MKGDDDDLLRLVATTKAAPRDDVENESCASKPSNSLPLNKKVKVSVDLWLYGEQEMRG